MTKIISSRFTTEEVLFHRLNDLLETLKNAAELDVSGVIDNSDVALTALEMVMGRFAADVDILRKAHSVLAHDFLVLSADNVRLQHENEVHKKNEDLAEALVHGLLSVPKDSIIIDDTLDQLIENSNATITSEFTTTYGKVEDPTPTEDAFGTHISAEKNDLRAGLKKALHYYVNTVGNKIVDQNS